LCWDVTVTCPLAGSYVYRAASEAGAAAEMAATRKEKYVDLGARYFFEPIAVETLAVFNASACVLLHDLGRRITSSSGEARDTSFLILYQRVSVLIQRYNAVVLQPLYAHYTLATFHH